MTEEEFTRIQTEAGYCSLCTLPGEWVAGVWTQSHGPTCPFYVAPAPPPATLTPALRALAGKASPDLHALGLTDAHIAALDSALFAVEAEEATDPVVARWKAGHQRRAAARSQGITLADVAALVGEAGA